jgi:RecA-family ATPase
VTPEELMLKDLDRSGLGLKQAKRHRFKARSAKFMRNLTGWDHVPGAIEIPYPGTDFSRYRWFKAWTYTDKKGKTRTARYWQPPKSPVHLYIPDGVELKSGVVLCEGEKKAVYATEQGIPTIAIGGVWNFRNYGALPPHLQALAATGAMLLIAFDGNTHTNSQVLRARTQLATMFVDAGGKVFTVDLPPDVNFDDFLVAEGKKGFDKLQRCAFQPSIVESLKFEPRPLKVFTDVPPPRKYVVNPWFGKGKLSFFAGTGGLGKSFLMLDLAASVALGHRWLGMPVTKGRVVILNWEDELEEIDRRLHFVTQNLARRRGATGKDLRELRMTVAQNVRIESLLGKELYFLRDVDRNVTRTPDVARLAAKLNELGPDLIIVDPLSRLHTLNENDNSIGSAIVSALDSLRAATGAAVLVPAHTNKEADKSNGRGGDTMAGMRGASALVNGGRSVVYGRVLDPGAAAKLFEVDPKEAVERFARITHVKNNYGPKMSPVYIVKGDEGVWNLHDSTEIPFKEKSAPGQMLSNLRRWLSKNEAETFSKTEVTQGKRQEIFGDSLSRTSAEKEFEAALDDGQIEKLSSSDRKRLKDLKGGGDRYRLVEEVSK